MRLANISPLKVAEYLKTNDTILFAIGSVENHGRHMPLGTDYLIPDEILRRLEIRIDPGEILIAPTLPYGSTDYFEGFAGTVSLGTELLTKLLERITDSYYEDGFRKFIILNGHGGNTAAIDRVSLGLHKKGARCLCLNWWKMAGELNPAWAGGHGGAEETAGILAVDPDLVDAEHLSDGQELHSDYGDKFTVPGFHALRFQGATIQAARPVTRYSANGWVGPDAPPEATKEWGEAMLDAMADYLAELIPAVKRL